jgi:hypothetical protein
MGDEFGVLAFDPAIARRIARLRQQGATVDLAVPPSRTHPLTVGCIVLIVVPLGVVLIGCALALAGIALAIDMLLLTPILLFCYFILRRVLG